MGMSEVISEIERDNFSKYMNPPEEYKPSDNEIRLLVKISEILKKGFSAEVKATKDDNFKVYEVRKNSV